MFDVSGFTLNKLIEQGKLGYQALFFRKNAFLEPSTWAYLKKTLGEWETHQMMANFVATAIISGQYTEVLDMMAKANSTVGWAMAQAFSSAFLGDREIANNPIVKDNFTEVSAFLKSYLMASGVPEDMLGECKVIGNWNDVSSLITSYKKFSTATIWDNVKDPALGLKARGLYAVDKHFRVNVKSLDGLPKIIQLAVDSIPKHKVYVSKDAREYNRFKDTNQETSRFVEVGAVTLWMKNKLTDPTTTGEAHSEWQITAHLNRYGKIPKLTVRMYDVHESRFAGREYDPKKKFPIENVADYLLKAGIPHTYTPPVVKKEVSRWQGGKDTYWSHKAHGYIEFYVGNIEAVEFDPKNVVNFTIKDDE